MAYIGKIPTVGNFQVCDAISVVNGQAAYTMQVSSVNVIPETANHMLVSLNGILQAPTSSFTVSGSTITFASNLVTGDVIDFIQILGSVLDLGVPSDSTVSLAKLTATGTKDATTFLRGDNTFAVPSGGKVLQVVSMTDSTQRTTSSTSLAAASGLSLAITPSATSSKVYIVVNGLLYNPTRSANASIFRATTNLASSPANMARINFTGDYAPTTTMIWLDSPSSTSAITYNIYFSTDNADSATRFDNDSVKFTMTLMEIGA